MCHIGTWSIRYCTRTAEKVWRSKVKKYGFAECQKITLGKSPLCRVLGEDTRQRVNGDGPLPSVLVCRVPTNHLFAECYCLPSARHSANHLFAECQLFAECFLSGTRQIAPLPSAR